MVAELMVGVFTVVKLACWVATHGEQQRWGCAVSGSRYTTDWNGCSLACLGDAERAALRGHPLGASLTHNQVLGVAQIEAGSMFHPLHVLDGTQKQQHSFWQAVFGSEALRGSLYYFRVSNAVAFHSGVPPCP